MDECSKLTCARIHRYHKVGKDESFVGKVYPDALSSGVVLWYTMSFEVLLYHHLGTNKHLATCIQFFLAGDYEPPLHKQPPLSGPFAGRACCMLLPFLFGCVLFGGLGKKNTVRTLNSHRDYACGYWLCTMPWYQSDMSLCYSVT